MLYQDRQGRWWSLARTSHGELSAKREGAPPVVLKGEWELEQLDRATADDGSPRPRPSQVNRECGRSPSQ